MFSLFLVPFVAVHIMFAGCPAYKPFVDDRGVFVYFSCYVPETNTIYLAKQDRHSVFVMAHERGHAYDFQALTDVDRAFLRPRWDREWFADQYARCALRIEPQRRDERVCRWLLRRSAGHAAAMALAHRSGP